ncbi:MAG: hypothetical protein JJU20_13330, partial [Opitutales bacterium]|nr:hypothetical protein [Opitutales bacterium]
MDYCVWQLPDFSEQARCYSSGVPEAAESRLQAWLEAAAWQHSPQIEATAAGVVTLHQPQAFKPKTLPPEAELDLRRAWAQTPDLAQLAIALTRPDHPEQWLDGPGNLDECPLSGLGLDSKTHSTLQSWGIHRCGAFRRLGRASIAAKLGIEAAKCWDRLSGRCIRPLVYLQPPRTFRIEQEWEYPLETLEPLLFLLKRLLHELSLQLAAACKVARSIELALKLDNRQADSCHHFQLPEPTRRPDILLRSLQVRLDRLRLAHPIIGLAIELEPTPEQQQQADIFVTALHDPHRFTETLAQLTALLGPDRVGSPVLCNSHRPDAVQLQPLRSRLQVDTPGARAHPAPGEWAPRPLDHQFHTPGARAHPAPGEWAPRPL